MRNVLTATSDGLALNSTAYQTLRDVLVQLAMGRIDARAEEYEVVDPQLSIR